MASNKANEILDAEMGNEVNLEAIEIENEEQLSFSSSQPRKFIIETCGPVLIINRGGTLACLFRNHLTLLPSLGTNIEYFAASLLANLEEENTPCSNHEDRDACQTIAIAVANLSELSVSIFTLNMRDNGNASTIFLEKLDITENKAITAMTWSKSLHILAISSLYRTLFFNIKWRQFDSKSPEITSIPIASLSDGCVGCTWLPSGTTLLLWQGIDLYRISFLTLPSNNELAESNKFDTAYCREKVLLGEGNRRIVCIEDIQFSNYQDGAVIVFDADTAVYTNENASIVDDTGLSGPDFQQEPSPLETLLSLPKREAPETRARLALLLVTPQGATIVDGIFLPEGFYPTSAEYSSKSETLFLISLASEYMCAYSIEKSADDTDKFQFSASRSIYGGFQNDLQLCIPAATQARNPHIDSFSDSDSRQRLFTSHSKEPTKIHLPKSHRCHNLVFMPSNSRQNKNNDFIQNRPTTTSTTVLMLLYPAPSSMDVTFLPSSKPKVLTAYKWHYKMPRDHRIESNNLCLQEKNKQEISTIRPQDSLHGSTFIMRQHAQVTRSELQQMLLHIAIDEEVSNVDHTTAVTQWKAEDAIADAVLAARHRMKTDNSDYLQRQINTCRETEANDNHQYPAGLSQMESQVDTISDQNQHSEHLAVAIKRHARQFSNDCDNWKCGFGDNSDTSIFRTCIEAEHSTPPPSELLRGNLLSSHTSESVRSTQLIRPVIPPQQLRDGSTFDHSIATADCATETVSVGADSVHVHEMLKQLSTQISRFEHTVLYRLDALEARLARSGL